MIALLTLFAALQAVDAWQTLIGLRRGRSERNPLARMLFERIGPVPGLALLKTGVVAALAALAYAGGGTMLLIIVNLIASAVVIHNLRVLRHR